MEHSGEIITSGDNMIKTYKTENIYNPKDFKNEVRRASKMTMDRTYIHVTLFSKASRLLLSIPGVKSVLAGILKTANKIALEFEKKELLESNNQNKQLENRGEIKNGTSIYN